MLRAARLFGRQIPRLDHRELHRFVESFLEAKDKYLAIAKRDGSPLYIIDTETLTHKAAQFKSAFAAVLPDINVFYALKSNSHPVIAGALIAEGIGIDVSSGLELEAALRYGAREIIFSGPGKLPEELRLAVHNASTVTVLVDSFGELERLDAIAAEAGVTMRIGVRLTTDDNGIWRKFGIPLDRLEEFFSAARSCGHIDLCGLQFHLSWNLSPKAHTGFITRLGAQLKQLDREFLTDIKFLDIGGGFWPETGEWLQAAATPRGMVQAALDQSPINANVHYKQPASSITEFAGHIARALRMNLPESLNCTICTEPGRWLCNDAMHILLTVVDRKADDVVITDGGTNAVGWERFESDYCPVINLSRPGLSEHACLVAGSLCTPHDIWGYSYFGQDIQVGDVLLVPNQGAYTYSLRQQFIKPLPNSVNMINARQSFARV